MSLGVKPLVLAVLEKRPETAVNIAKEIGHPRPRVSCMLNYLKQCGIVHRTNAVWSLK